MKQGIIAALLIGCMTINASAQNAVVTDQDVQNTTRALVDSIKRSQNADGSWTNSIYPVGITGLCLMALLQAEVPANDPVVKLAATYISEHADGKVYSEGLAAVALEQLSSVVFRKRIAQAYNYLADAQGKAGSWSYSAERKTTFDHSNAQFAILGIGAAERAGIDIDENMRKAAINHWLAAQGKDGGWGYTGGGSTPAMTCAGIASLHLLGVEYSRKSRACGPYEYHRPMQRAVQWLTNLAKTPDNLTKGRSYYAMYALERVAIFLGIKEFSGFDWYRWGAARIVSSKPAGAEISDRALALLFLAKGSSPIAIAKWKWPGDWNNQHYDAANWCKFAGIELGRKLDWLNAPLDTLDSPAAKASLIFVNGTQDFKPSPEEMEFLKSFLDAGGTVVAEITCGERRFVNSFKRSMLKHLYRETSPRWVPVTRQHPVVWAKHKLQLKDVSALEFRAGCKRLNLLVLERNISCALNGDLDVQKDLKRAQKVSTNLIAWALSKKNAGKKLDELRLDEPVNDLRLTQDQVKRKAANRTHQYSHPFGRIKHGGNWYASPAYFDTLDQLLKLKEEFPKFDAEVYVTPISDDLFNSAVAFMTGYSNPVIGKEASVNLRTYLNNGGTLFAANACTSREFHWGFQRLMLSLFPNDKLEEIPSDDSIYKAPFDLTKRPATGTTAYETEHGKKWAPLLGIKREGRWLVVYSPLDLTSDMSEGLHDSIIGYKRESAAMLSVNILYNALRP